MCSDSWLLSQVIVLQWNEDCRRHVGGTSTHSWLDCNETHYSSKPGEVNTAHNTSIHDQKPCGPLMNHYERFLASSNMSCFCALGLLSDIWYQQQEVGSVTHQTASLRSSPHRCRCQEQRVVHERETGDENARCYFPEWSCQEMKLLFVAVVSEE